MNEHIQYIYGEYFDEPEVPFLNKKDLTIKFNANKDYWKRKEDILLLSWTLLITYRTE